MKRCAVCCRSVPSGSGGFAGAGLTVCGRESCMVALARASEAFAAWLMARAAGREGADVRAFLPVDEVVSSAATPERGTSGGVETASSTGCSARESAPSRGG